MTRTAGYGLRKRVMVCLAEVVFSLAAAAVIAGDDPPPVIHVTLGDYRFDPAVIHVSAGQAVVLELENADGITPHNFSLKDAAGLDIDIDVPAGDTRRVTLVPAVNGSYAFYCNKKLPFMKSHRDRGMQGSLVVDPE